MDVLFQDEVGDHVYQVVKGEGFEKGKRVGEVTYGNYWLNEESVGVNLEELDYIRYSTKEISVGDLVSTTPLYEGDSETYLIIDSQEAFVVTVESALHPFMQEPVKLSLGFPEESTIYNLGDVRMFLKNISLLVGMLITLLASLGLWLEAWRGSKSMVIRNTVICGGLFWGFYQLVQKLNFPDSLLPHANIFEFGYYKREFGEILDGLKQADVALFSEIKRLLVCNAVSFSMIVLGGGVLLLIRMKGLKKYTK